MESILRTVENVDWITIVILISILFITAAKGLFYQRFLNFIQLPFNNKYVFMYNKKDTLWNWFNILMTLFQLLNFALFVYFAKSILFTPEKDGYVIFYFGVLSFLFLFLVLKVALQLFNGFVFNANKNVIELIFKKLSYFNHSSIIMFLANLMLCYVLNDSKLVIYLSIFLILLINLAGWITVLRNHQKFIMSNFFYFILYLCALEIAPLIIIGSYLKD